jgi:hypothetical protein
MGLYRVVVDWSGQNVVGLAKNVLHFDDTTANPDTAAIRSAYALLGSALATSTTIRVPGTGDHINSATGALAGTWSTSTPAAIVGSSTDTTAAGVGACVNWNTAGIVNFRKVRGRTFLAPLSTFAFDAQGTITTAQLTALNNFAAAMLAIGTLAVWHRPTTPGGSDGNQYLVNGISVRDRVAYLSSRRS